MKTFTLIGFVFLIFLFGTSVMCIGSKHDETVILKEKNDSLVQKNKLLLILIDDLMEPINLDGDTPEMDEMLRDSTMHGRLHEMLDSIYHGDTTAIPFKFRLIAC